MKESLKCIACDDTKATSDLITVIIVTTSGDIIIVTTSDNIIIVTTSGNIIIAIIDINSIDNRNLLILSLVTTTITIVPVYWTDQWKKEESQV